MKLGDNIPDYDAIGRRNAEPDFSFAEKKLQPKLFNGNGEVVHEKGRAFERNPSALKRRGESVEVKAKSKSFSNRKASNSNFKVHAFMALKSIQKILKKPSNSDSKIQEISKIVEEFDGLMKDLDESC